MAPHLRTKYSSFKEEKEVWEDGAGWRDFIDSEPHEVGVYKERDR
jgi:hypothetical protein